MFVSRSIGICVLFNLAVLCQGDQRDHRKQQSQNDGLGLGFPENEEEDPSKKNAQSKNPVNLPSRCKPGELLYPGDQGDDWVCDCKPAYIYYPERQQCYPAHTKGPCRDGDILVLPPNAVIPICAQNPCGRGNRVYFQNGCYELDKPGPCQYPTYPNVVGVNETTLELICTKDYMFGIGSRVSEMDLKPKLNETNYFEKECFRGGSRWSGVKCPYQDNQRFIQQIQATFTNYPSQ